MTISTLIAAISVDGIAMPMNADGTHVSFGPLYSVEMLIARFFIRESFDKLAETKGFFHRHS